MTDFSDMVKGYGRFREQSWIEQRERWEELGRGQSPKVMVIACSDSRVDPMQIFDVAPGEIFAVRNVANLVPPYETSKGYHGVSAAIEFAVTQLEVQFAEQGHPLQSKKIKAISPGGVAHVSFAPVSPTLGIPSKISVRSVPQKTEKNTGNNSAQYTVEYQG